ncbi:MAG: hypothetical protein Q7W13_16475 [Bacteroidia bacterium]|nr:hypothetical protein [Bacteroidia bacterium]
MLKRPFFFCSIVVFFSFNLGIAAQNDSVKNHSTENWKINFQIAPNYAYRIAKRINDDPARITGTSPYRVNEENNMYSWHFSISGAKKIAQWLDLNLGVIIDNQGYTTKEFQAGSHSSNVYNYRYFGLSLSSTEKLKLNDKTYFFFKNGINYYFQNQLRSTDWGGKNIDYLRPTNDLSVFVFAGVYYKIEKKYSLSISPFFNYFLTPLTNPQAWNGSSYQQNFFSTGIELGVHYNIGKK